MPENKPTSDFKFSMERTPLLLGLIYLPVHIFLLPLLLNMYADVAPSPPSDVMLNAAYYGISAVVVLLVLFRYLRADFDTLLDRPVWNLLTLIEAYFIELLLTYVAVLLTKALAPVPNPSDADAAALAAAGYSRLRGVLILLAPLVEETLFRGVVFGALRRRGRLTAYVVSIAAYAVCGVWQYVWQYGDAAYLVYALQFVPAGLAMAWCYERSGSIWLPVLLHIVINAIGFYAV